jgi:hypothetical protein
VDGVIGNRNIAAPGIVRCVKMFSNEWWIDGVGII